MPLKKLFILLITILALIVVLTSCAPAQSDYVKVSFFVDGKPYQSYWVKKGGSLLEEPEVPDKEGMVGIWSTLDFDDLQNDLQVDAIYSNANCTVSFMVDDAIVATVTVKKNSSLTSIPKVPEKVGYEGEWNYTDFSNIAQDITVKAEYTPIAYTVRFMNGNDLYATRIANYGESVTNIPDLPTPISNWSAKWVREDKSPPILTNIKSDITIYVYYYITLELVNSYLSNSTYTLDLDKEIDEIPVGDRAGYDFYGWYFDADLTQKVEFPYEFTENTQLFARWLKTSSADDFTIVDGVVTSYTGADTNVIVPYKYDDGDKVSLVTGIGENAFNNSATITSISIPGTVTTFAPRAFSGLTALKELVFPDQNSIRTIGAYAFENCYMLERFEAGNLLVEIGDNAFNNCNSLSLVDLGNVQTIGDYAFSGIQTISHIDIPSTVQVIGALAFQNMINTTFAFPSGNNVVYVGDRAFENCYQLKEFVAPKLQGIGEYVFSGCKTLEKATMMSNGYFYKLFGTASIENSYTISDQTTTYYVPKSLVNMSIIANLGGEWIVPGVMATNALIDAYYVKNVTLSGNFTLIESYAFDLRDEQKITEPNFNITISSVTKIDNYAFFGRKDIAQINLPSSVYEIGEYAFFELDRLGQVAIEQNNGLTIVGKCAFEGTKWLTEYQGIARLGRIALGFGTDFIGTGGRTSLMPEDFDGLTTISAYAFANNTRLTDIIIPPNITTIGDEAFKSCQNLLNIQIPIQCQSLGIDVLSGCSSLSTIEIGLSADLHTLFGKDYYDNSYTVSRDGESHYIPLSLKTLTLLADSQIEIYEDRYNGYSSLTSIVLGEKITKIYDLAFANNTSLTTINIPNSLVEIGALTDGQERYEGAFYNCPSLTTLNVHSSASNLAIIYDKAFYNSSLTSVHIPPMLTNIGAYAFANTNIRLLSFADGESDLTIGDYAFSGIRASVKYSIVLPSNLVKLGEYAFYDNNNLNKVTFTSQVTKIGKFAFANCDLGSFILPSSVELYDDENNCLVYGLLQNNNNMTELTLHNGITIADLFISNYPTNLVKVTVNGGKIIDEQFRNMTSLQRVELNDITHIGKYAFDGCNNANLVAIAIPPSVVEICDNAFSNCTGLINLLNLNNTSLISLGKRVFEGNTKLEQAIFPDTVTNTSWDGIFNGCVRLSYTNIPQSVVEIGDNTFNNCNSLASINIPANIVSIGNNAFSNCYELVFENSNFEFLQYIGENAFKNCYKLTALKTENVEEIGENAFLGCLSIREITILDLSPSDYIDNATQLETVNVSRHASMLLSQSFAQCQNLVMIYFATDDSAILDQMLTVLKEDKLSDNLAQNVGIFILSKMYTELIDKIDSYQLAIYSYPTLFDVESYRLNDNDMTATLISSGNASGVLYIPRRLYVGELEYLVTEIGERAFKNNQNIISVIIPSAITRIHQEAFSNCQNLTDVTFEAGSGLTLIGDYAFENCENLTIFAMPDSVENIGIGAFNDCEKLASVTISKNSHLQDIGEFAFSKTAWLRDYDGIAVLNGIAIGFGEIYVANGLASEITIDDLNGVIKIAPFAFYGVYGLTNVEIPDSVIMIGKNAFADNKNLTSVTFKRASELNTEVFNQCVNLQSIYILSDSVSLVSEMLSILSQEDIENLTVYIKEEVHLALSQEIELLDLTVEIVS